ncbi:4a-hydroxytetrahydrobiopterin dehydratase [Thioalkalivibrio sp. XN279]|uniref:4a-hydroxytetrahydrobiopterin dehydratase n=1 Tax=Thioalkalivibrio sp. XN279 TaxID=2714953 RepID=UPI001407A2FE|nr:4a-hydroxytetrahydrobiopterin dehydratase [Thioalkalivibrio sp. XN279]
MSDLTAKHCVPCEGGLQPMSATEAREFLGRLHADWTLNEDATEIRRDFLFKGFNRTMGFVNAVAWIANSENHHPDLEVGWGHCLVRFSTHAIKGLSENDFICAAKVDALLDE